jgi:trigger factor
VLKGNDHLKIDVERREDHQALLTVEVDSGLLEDAKQRAARHISRHTKIPGFRPGKAPYALVQRVVGDEAILEEAVELLVNDVYPGALDEAKIEPYGPGSLEKIKSTDPPVFEFLVPLKAEVELGDFHAIRLPYEVKEVTDDDVENVITGLREQQAVVEPADRPVQEGDLVYAKLSARRKQPEEGEEEFFIKERSVPINVLKEGDRQDNEWPLPGFSHRFIGHSVGDEIVVDYTYPEDATFEAMRGKDAEFTAVIESVKSRTLPELNDEFAQSAGDFPTLEALRSQIRKNLEEQNQQMTDEEYDEQVLEKIVETSTVKFPPQMLEREIEQVIENLTARLERQRLDLDLYMKSRQIDKDGLREEARPVAQSRIKKSLVLFEIADQVKINVTSDDLQAETERTLNDFARVMPEKDFQKLMSSREGRSDLIGNIMTDMVIARTRERLRDIARGVEPVEVEPAEASQETAAPAEVETQEETKPAESEVIEESNKESFD